MKSFISKLAREEFAFTFESYSRMTESDVNFSSDQKLSTGGTGWKVTSEATNTQLKNGLYAYPINNVCVLDFGADNTGAVDVGEAFNAAKAIAVNTKKPLLVPAGTYVRSAIVYDVLGDFVWNNAGFDDSIINILQSAASTITLLTQSGGRTALSIQSSTQAGDTTSSNGIRINQTSYSDNGGTTGTYVRLNTDAPHIWGAASFVETRMGVGGICAGFVAECVSYGATGQFLGQLIKNSTSPTVGDNPANPALSPTSHPTATGTYYLGGADVDDMGGWRYIIRFDANSKRNSAGTSIRDEAIGTIGYHITSGAYNSDADIKLEGDSNVGLKAHGNYSGAAISVYRGEFLAMENTNNYGFRFSETENVIHAGTKASDSISFDLTTTPGLRVSGVKVIGTQRPAISDSVGGDEQTKINAILTALRTHGLIDT